MSLKKNVNASFALILNMDERLHTGRGSVSTWEYAKDISLAIAAKQTSCNNTIEFFSNDTFVAKGSGVEHMNFLEMVICTLELSKSEKDYAFIKRAVLDISSEAKVLYITPAYPGPLMDEALDVLRKYSKVNPNIHVAFIDGTYDLAGTINGAMAATYKGLHIQTQNHLKRNIKELNDCGIECSLITIDSASAYQKVILNSLVTTRGEVNDH